MDRQEILGILKKAANFEYDENGEGFGAINRCSECNESMTQYDYTHNHYPKMAKLLESLPWEKVVRNPRQPMVDDYPKEDGEYITMMDCNEHEVCTNTFRNGGFSWMNKTHIKWWMKKV